MSYSEKLMHGIFLGLRDFWLLFFLLSNYWHELFLRFFFLRHAHKHQRDPEGEEPKAISPQSALPGPESDSSNQPQPVPVCASEPGA